MSGKCVVCGETSGSPWGAENGFEAVCCGACGLVYLDPWPDMSARDKALEYGEHPGEKVLRTNHRYHAREKRRYANIIDQIYGADFFDSQTVRWLDIGCGYGEFLETLGDRVHADSVLQGSEPNQAKQASAQARGLDVAFYDLEIMTDEYTHVSLLNVFSHLPDPVAFLGLARQRLGPGGEILLQTGNGGDVSRSEFPGMLGFPDHLLFGGRRSLELVFEKLGMEIVSVTALPFPPMTPVNVAKDLVKRIVRKQHNAVRWGGPYRDLWVRARIPI